MRNAPESIVRYLTALCLSALALTFTVSCSDTAAPVAPGQKTGRDASLGALSTSIPSFPGAFSTDLFAYATSVKRTVDSVSIIAFATDPTAAVFMHDPNVVGQRFLLDSTGFYGPAPLIVGNNIFVVEVLSADLNQTELYTLTIERLPSDTIPL